MKISELKDKQGQVNIDVKIVWDLSVPKEMFGKMIKPVLVVDADATQGDGSPTAYLDLFDADIGLYKKGDKIRLTNAYAKLIKNDKGQFRLTNVRKIEKIE